MRHHRRPSDPPAHLAPRSRRRALSVRTSRRQRDLIAAPGRRDEPVVDTFADMADTTTPSRVPLVEYLVLDDGDPHLVANECINCGARFFDRRNACASCFDTDFRRVTIATQGELRTFTIVAFAAPGVEVPFVSGVIDCDGTSVRGNLRNVEPDADHVHTGMQVKLVTYSLGVDDHGTEAIAFAFEPA
jgi:uncharacterized OB-fold protein